MSFILFILAAICNAVIDVTQFHYYRSIFNNEPFSESWWNGNISWRNKYKNGTVSQGRNNIPVWFTDAFHFFKSLMITLLALAVVFYKPLINWWVDFIALGLSWNIFFSLFYKHILKTRTYE
jgi:hypothetical protein